MELKEQKFGIEIEMTGITRAKAAEVTAEYFGTRVKYLGTYYDTYAAIDTEGRQWKFMSDGSITAQKKSNGRKINAGREYQTEMVSPICRYEDIVTIQEIIRKLKEYGALFNEVKNEILDYGLFTHFIDIRNSYIAEYMQVITNEGKTFSTSFRNRAWTRKITASKQC